jgi:hypothetical protein
VINTILKRVGEIVVGLVGLLVAALTLWTCYDVMVHPPETAPSRWSLVAITAFLALIALAVSVFSVRLFAPRLRIEGGHIITLQGLAGFLFLYALGMVVALLYRSPTAAGLVPGMLVIFSVAVLIWERIRTRQAP